MLYARWPSRTSWFLSDPLNRFSRLQVWVQIEWSFVRLACGTCGNGSVVSLNFDTLDPAIGSVDRNFMGPLQRAINLIIALTLVVLGWGGFAYFYFNNASWPWGIKVASAMVGFAGLYWLWDEHINVGHHGKD
jgi:hypothetical protein